MFFFCENIDLVWGLRYICLSLSLILMLCFVEVLVIIVVNVGRVVGKVGVVVLVGDGVVLGLGEGIVVGDDVEGEV